MGLVNRQRRLLYSSVALTVLLALVAASTRAERPGATLGGGIRWSTSHVKGEPPPNPNFTPLPGRPPSDKSPTKSRGGFTWLTIVVLASAALLIVIVFAALTRRRRDELEPEIPLATALDDLLLDTLEDLRSERDPRRAVIRAYARTEKTFAAYGVPRQEHETPLEYVGRVLDSLTVSGYAVRRLVQLFERAKFSTHEIDLAMKDEAIDALEDLRTQLQPRQEAA